MTQTKKRRIYISGPMRGRQFYNFPAFDAAKQALERIGYEVVSPADMDRELRHFDGLLCDPSDPCSGTPIYRDYVTGEPGSSTWTHASGRISTPCWVATSSSRLRDGPNPPAPAPRSPWPDGPEGRCSMASDPR